MARSSASVASPAEPPTITFLLVSLRYPGQANPISQWVKESVVVTIFRKTRQGRILPCLFYCHPPSDATYNVEFNRDTKAVLKLNLMRMLTQNTFSTYAAFSTDGKYLATASVVGIVYIFDVTAGKRLR